MKTIAVYLNNKFIANTCLAILVGVTSMTTGCAMKRAKYTFGIVSDIQYSSNIDPEYAKKNRSLETLEKTVEHFNSKEMIDNASYIGYSRKPSFIVQLGDAIEGGQNAAEELDKVVAIFDKAKAKKYHVLGNHEFNGLDRKYVLKKLKLKKAYYDFTKKHIRFVVLDTSDISLSGGWPKTSDNYRSAENMLKKLEQQKAANAQIWNSAIGPQQKQWLRSVLADAQNKEQKVVVFGHHPLVPGGDIYGLWNADEITAILESYNCVAAYINGHRHKDSYLWQNGVCYVTIEGLFESEDRNVYAIAWVYADRIMIESTGQPPRLEIPLE